MDLFAARLKPCPFKATLHLQEIWSRNFAAKSPPVSPALAANRWPKEEYFAVFHVFARLRPTPWVEKLAAIDKPHSM
jgi:hypothetical protein